VAALSDREYDLARALARVTHKLHTEFEKSQASLPAKNRLTWPDCWAEAQDGWDTLVHHGFVDARRRPYVPTHLSNRISDR
jgi:hypothetical protein